MDRVTRNASLSVLYNPRLLKMCGVDDEGGSRAVRWHGYKCESNFRALVSPFMMVRASSFEVRWVPSHPVPLLDPVLWCV